MGWGGGTILLPWTKMHVIVSLDKIPPWTKVSLDNCLLGLMSPRTNVSLDKCPLDNRLLGHLSPWTNVPWTTVSLDTCLLGHMDLGQMSQHPHNTLTTLSKHPHNISQHLKTTSLTTSSQHS